MKTRRYLIILFVSAFCPANASQTADPAAGYAYWSTYKPGTMVSFKCLTKGSGTDQTTIKTLTLTSVSPDVAIVENREIPASGGAPSPSLQPPLGIRLEFRASASPKENEDNFQTYLVTNIESLLRDVDFLALPASPAEVAALRNARKPEWVEVTGLQFVTVHSTTKYGKTS